MANQRIEARSGEIISRQQNKSRHVGRFHSSALAPISGWNRRTGVERRRAGVPSQKHFFASCKRRCRVRLWDLRGIDVNVFANLMLPKLKAEGRLNSFSGEVRNAQLN